MSPTPTPETGPRTEDGKATAALNATRDGLFAEEDFIRPGEESEYDELCDNLALELSPEGELESAHYDEIVSAKWRLRRCRIVEAALALRADAEFNLSDADEKRQLSVDRARNQANNTLRRAVAELRKLQTERHLRNEIGTTGVWGLADMARILQCRKLATATRAAECRESDRQFEAALNKTLYGPSPLPHGEQAASPAQTTPASEESEIPFCKNAPVPVPEASKPIRVQPKPGRNEPCPCKSGLKYKKCCGGPAAQTGAATPTSPATRAA